MKLCTLLLALALTAAGQARSRGELRGHAASQRRPAAAAKDRIE